MSYFIRVGLIEENHGRMGARGWHIRRTGRVVNVKFGAVHVLRRRVFWYGPGLPQVVRPKRFGSERAARDFVRWLIGVKKSKGYQPLPPGRRICRYREVED